MDSSPKQLDRLAFKYVMKSRTSNENVYVKWTRPDIDFNNYVVFRCERAIPNQPEKLLNGDFDAQLTKFTIDQDITELIDDTDTRECRYLVVAFDKSGDAYSVESLDGMVVSKAKPENPFYLSIMDFKKDEGEPVPPAPAPASSQTNALMQTLPYPGPGLPPHLIQLPHIPPEGTNRNSRTCTESEKAAA